jgi:two-component system chemotaxis response regulator CheB
MTTSSSLQDAAVSSTHGHDLVVIGASAGGIAAIRTLLSQLPADLPAAILIVLHLAPDAGSMLPHIFGAAAAMPVRFAEDKATLSYGEARIAPPDRHLLVEFGHVRVVRGPRENGFRPGIDPLFRSAAWAYGPRVIGVLLSGMLRDGSAGLWAIKSCGGITVVQDPRDAEFRDMPRNALEHLPVDHCLAASDIGALLVDLVRQPVPASADFRAPDQFRIETDMLGPEPTGDVRTMNQIGKLSPYTCPSCHGSLWEVFDEHVLRFRCHTGHGFSADSLDGEQKDVLENALFGALRALQENARLARTVAATSRQQQREGMARVYEEKAAENDSNADVIRDILLRSRSEVEA